MRKALIFANAFFVIFKAHAWAKDFHIDSMKFSIDVPKEWRATEGLFEIPLTLTGPMKNEARPVITVTPTELKKVYFNVKDETKVNADYKEKRLKWLQKHKGEFITLDAYQNLKWEGVEAAHSLGYSYKINEIVFLEKSFYVICKERLYHLKYLLRENQRDSLPETDRIIKSFRCLN